MFHLVWSPRLALSTVTWRSDKNPLRTWERSLTTAGEPNSQQSDEVSPTPRRRAALRTNFRGGGKDIMQGGDALDVGAIRQISWVYTTAG